MPIDETVLAVLLVVLIVVDFPQPAPLNAALNSPPGVILMLLVVYYLFTKSQILGSLGLVAAFILFQRAGGMGPKSSLMLEVEPGLPAYDANMLTPSNQFTKSLEESVVNNLVPLVANGGGNGAVPEGVPA